MSLDTFNLPLEKKVVVLYLLDDRVLALTLHFSYIPKTFAGDLISVAALLLTKNHSLTAAGQTAALLSLLFSVYSLLFVL